MKREYIFILTLIALVVVITSLFFVFRLNTRYYDSRAVYSFDMNMYSVYIEACANDRKNVGPVTTREKALETALELWKDDHVLSGVEVGYPVYVSYDFANDCWRVHSSLTNPKADGAVLHALILKDGTVLAVFLG